MIQVTSLTVDTGSHREHTSDMSDRVPEYLSRRWYVYDARERIVSSNLTEAEAKKIVSTDTSLRYAERNLG